MNREVIEKVVNQSTAEIPTLMKADVREIILYGSCARGDYTDDSDIDVAILTDSDRKEVKRYGDGLDDLAARIGMETFAVVNYVCLPYQEFEDKKSWYPYFMNISKEGILLYER